jgi:NADPH-dependent glutamate synthase beta subunit-like oxidoreductase/coenzyme F420-reducing hydrogenase delta subunit/NAD-dependent dihydropyrimidine dehydrogenase PreA subunit
MTDTRTESGAGLAGAGLLIPALQPEPFRIQPVEPSPCTQACPAGINVKSYVSLIAEGRFTEALEVVREHCPLPGICGRICHHPCETACKRCEIDQPIAIRALKRFIADFELEAPLPEPPPPPDKTERVAVIGSGPAGLTAAYDLRLAGYPVTVFEAAPEAGGMLRYGIADYRLPTDVLDMEIAVLAAAGIEIQTDSGISSGDELEDLLSDYAAALFAVGAQRGRRLGLAGEDDCAEIEDALSFLRRVNGGDHTPVVGRVLVIGGGSTAIEAARAALRLGAESVEIVYRRHRGEMPADEEEIEVAGEEGIEFRLLTSPAGIVTGNGRLEGLECLEVALGEPDDSGRRRPIPIPGSEFVLKADRIFAAIGQEAVLDFLPERVAKSVTERGLIHVDPETAMTAMHGIFAAGDVVTGPSTVIDAIAAGHRAAEAMRHFLEEGKPRTAEDDSLLRANAEYEIPTPPPAPARRRQPVHASIVSGREFEEVEFAFTAEAAVAEAQRCMRCGPCSECLICAASCGRRHITLRQHDHGTGSGTGEIATLLRAPARIAVGLEGGGESAGGWLLGAADWGHAERDAEPNTDQAVDLAPNRITIEEDYCRGCARCIEVCAFDAIGLVDPEATETTVSVEPALCRGCNLCVAVCPTDAAIPSTVAPGWWGTRFEDLYQPLLAASSRSPLVVFACQRRVDSVRKSLDEQQLSPSDAHLVPVRCAGQLDAGVLLELYRHGAGGFLIAGCLTGSCRYGFGPQLAAEQVLRIRKLLTTLGGDPDCVVADWAGEGETESLELQMLGIVPEAGRPASVNAGRSKET